MAPKPPTGLSDGRRSVTAQRLSGNVSFETLERLKNFDIHQLRTLSREEVTVLIQNSQRESAEYDREIGRLQSMVIALQGRKQMLESEMKKLKSLLSPIRRLPAEVLSEIFKAFMQGRLSCEISDEQISIPPSDLTKVCWHWRSIALSTPSLWSKLGFNVASSQEDPRLLKAVSLVLERSKKHFLSISLDMEEIEEEEEEELCPALRRLMEEAWRWESVRLWLPYNRVALRFWGLTLDLPNLRTLSLSLSSFDGEVLPCRLVAFQQAPNLRGVTLESNNAAIEDGNWVLLPWTQLLSIECTSALPHRAAKILSSCTYATSAHIIYKELSSRFDIGSSAPFQTSIHSLVFDFQFYTTAKSETMTTCLNQLQLIPSLRSVVLTSAAGAGLSQAQSFIAALTQYKLTSLVLHNIYFSHWDNKEAFHCLLNGLPSLESLSILERCSTWETWDDGLLSQMNGYSDRAILPILQHLTLEAKGHHISDMALVDLVCSRWRPLADENRIDQVTSLRSVRFILFERACMSAVIQPLVHMATAGLAVAVIDESGRVV
jgi:hypothetical protein